MRADAGLTADPHYPSVLAQELVSCTIIALFMQLPITDTATRRAHNAPRGSGLEPKSPRRFGQDLGLGKPRGGEPEREP
jgi:hypothetical protein